jgi:hypothetical protein
MSGGIWGTGTWGVDVWGTPVIVPPDPGTAPPGSAGVGQPGGSGYTGIGVVATIELGASMMITQMIQYAPPPPQVIPLRNYRSVMDSFRVLGGKPVAPPVIDVSIPVGVTVGLTQVPVPNSARALPPDIDTGATLRWYADSYFLHYSGSGHETQWLDTEGDVAWTAYDTYQPVFAPGYNYLIPSPNSAESLTRPALVFDPTRGTCMNTDLSLDEVNSVDDLEWLMVVWSHPLAAGAQASTILDNGGPVQGLIAMPFAVSDSVVGMRQGLSRFTGDGLLLWQDQTGFPMWWAQISNGRPVLVRARFGEHPLLECWGPKGIHMVHRSVLDQPRQALASNYVLGREFGQVSAQTNAGMHLMEINYYDHALGDDELASAVQALDACYAVSS